MHNVRPGPMELGRRGCTLLPTHPTQCAQRCDKMMQTDAFLTDKGIALAPFAAESYPGSAPDEGVEGTVRIQP